MSHDVQIKDGFSIQQVSEQTKQQRGLIKRPSIPGTELYTFVLSQLKDGKVRGLFV